MQELLAVLQGATGLIEKGGIIGLMLIVIGVMGYEINRLRKENVRAFRQRDKARLGWTLYRAAAEGAGLKVDVSAMEQFADDDHDE